jgi:hypothetical protein
MANPSPYYWDARVLRYRDSAGRFVRRTTVNEAFNEALIKAASDIRGVGDQLQGAQTTLRAFQLEVEQNIKNVHIGSAVLARGGWEQMTPADWGKVGNIIKQELQYFRRFVGQLGDGLPINGRFFQRLEAYITAGRETFMVFDREEHRRNGYDEESNQLAVAEHCSECDELASRGWVPIGTLKPVGQRICLHRCRCRIVYRRSVRISREA